MTIEMTFEYAVGTLIVLGLAFYPLWLLWLVGSFLLAVIWDVLTYIRETPRRRQLKQLDIDYRYVLKDPGKLRGGTSPV